MKDRKPGIKLARRLAALRRLGRPTSGRVRRVIWIKPVAFQRWVVSAAGVGLRPGQLMERVTLTPAMLAAATAMGGPHLP